MTVDSCGQQLAALSIVAPAVQKSNWFVLLFVVLITY